MRDEAIHKAVDAARTFLQNDAERRAYINRELAILDYNSDHRDAFEEGRAEGQQSSDKRWENLMSMLLKEKRYDEAVKAVSDKGFRETLFKKYGLEYHEVQQYHSLDSDSDATAPRQIRDDITTLYRPS